MTDTRLLLQDETERILRYLESRLTKEGMTQLSVLSFWQGELRWSRNAATLTSDRRDIRVAVNRTIRGGSGSVLTNQIDAVSLDSVVQTVEAQARSRADQRPRDSELAQSMPSAMTTTTWSDATFGRTAEQNAKIVQQATAQAAAKQMLSAGYLEMRGLTIGQRTIDAYGRVKSFYTQMTQAQCSTTVRHPKGTGSGWAGLSSYDIAKIDEAAIAARALDKCLASIDAVRIEPGRYTTILEPQAVSSLVDVLFSAMDRLKSESSRGVFWLSEDATIQRDRTKLGQRVIDERITIQHDPSDPMLGVPAVPGVQPITWIKDGVLQTLAYDRSYALKDLNSDDAAFYRWALRMTGGSTSMEEMITTTKRGLLVTRLVFQDVLDRNSLLSTGVTRDGLWLIENGKITKAVRNFRWTESPLFAFNNVMQLGSPVPVFSPRDSPESVYFAPVSGLMPKIVPPLKVNDFSFTSTIDAV